MKKYFIVFTVIFLIVCSSFSDSIKNSSDIYNIFIGEIDTIFAKSASDLSKKIIINSKRKVAVVDFVNSNGQITEFGRYLAENYSVQLVNKATNFSVVDRNYLRKLMNKHKLSMKDSIDPKTAKEIRKVAGVDALIVGSYTPLKDNVKVTVKAIDIGTSDILFADSLEIVKKGQYTKMMRNVIGKKKGTQKTNIETDSKKKNYQTNTETVSSNTRYQNFTVSINESKLYFDKIEVTLKNLEFTKYYVKGNIILNYNTNIDSDFEKILFYKRESEVVDNEGNITRNKKVRVANQEGQYSYKIYPNINVKVHLKFKRPKNKIKLLRIELNKKRNSSFRGEISSTKSYRIEYY